MGRLKGSRNKPKHTDKVLVDLGEQAEQAGVKASKLVRELAEGPAKPVAPLKHVYRENTRDKKRRARYTVEREPVPSFDEMAKRAPKVPRKPVSSDGRQTVGKVSTFDVNWVKILRCRQNGWTYSDICVALGVAPQAFSVWMSRHPERREELDSARMNLRNDMMDIMIGHAKSGRNNSFIAASIILERLWPRAFAQPQVQLQFAQLESAANETIQTFGGKTLQQLAQEMRQTLAGDPNFEKSVRRIDKEAKRLESEGYDVDLSVVNMITQPQDDPDQEPIIQEGENNV
jgi:hypothetical protein